MKNQTEKKEHNTPTINIDNVNYAELLHLLRELNRKVNELHRLHFPDPFLKKQRNLKEKFLAEIFITPARNKKITVK